MNKKNGTAKKYYKRLYKEIWDELKKQDYSFLMHSKKAEGEGSAKRESLTLPVNKYFEEPDGERSYLSIAVIDVSSVDTKESEIEIAPAQSIDERKNEYGYFEGQRKEYENIVQIVKALGVRYDDERPDPEDAPFEIIKGLGAHADDVFYLKVWLVIGDTAEDAAKKIHESKEYLDRKIGDIRKKYDKKNDLIPKGQKERRKFKEGFVYYLRDWQQELEQEIKDRGKSG